MRIMLLGDSHGNLGFMSRAVQVAYEQEAQAIIQLGDFGVWDHVPKGVRFLDGVNAILEEHQMSMVFIDGNHENFDSLERYPLDEGGFRPVRQNILHAPRGHRFEVDGVRFLAFGGAHSIDGPGGPPWWQQARGPLDQKTVAQGPRGKVVLEKGKDLGSWWPQELITQEQVDAVSPHHVDVLLSHDCPAGIKIPGINGYPAGDEQRRLLREVMDKVQPQLVVHGHYHKFHHGRLDNGETNVVGLAADVNKYGQYCFLETEPLRLDIPNWRNA